MLIFDTGTPQGEDFIRPFEPSAYMLSSPDHLPQASQVVWADVAIRLLGDLGFSLPGAENPCLLKLSDILPQLAIRAVRGPAELKTASDKLCFISRVGLNAGASMLRARRLPTFERPGNSHPLHAAMISTRSQTS